MHLQLELAQSFRRDEVYTVDQPAQLCPDLLAVVALDGLVQILGEPPIGLGRAGVQLDHRRGGVGRQSGLDLAPPALQRRADRLQFVRLDRTLQAHGLRALQFAIDLCEFALQRRPLNLKCAALGLCGGVKGSDGLCDCFGRQQVGLDASEDAFLHCRGGDDLAVGAGPTFAVAAAVIFVGVQGHAEAALLAFHQAGQQAFRFAALRGGQGGQFCFAVLHSRPEFIVNDAQFWSGLADPVFRRIQHR